MRILDTRACEARNVYCHRPVLVMQLDLEEAAETPSSRMPELLRELPRLLPGLEEHHCSRGRRGGFLERLAEGTWLGHVVEHVWLELQCLAGQEVYFGRTCLLQEPATYQVVCEYQVREAGLRAGALAVELVDRVRAGQPFALPQAVEEIRRLAVENQPGPSTAAILAACRRMDIPVLHLGGSLWQLGWGVHQERVRATLIGRTSCVAVDIAGDKELTARLLSGVGLPVPCGQVVNTAEEAVALLMRLTPPLVVKPVDGNHGRGVSLNVGTPGEMRAAFARAAAEGRAVRVEEQVAGRQYRLLVVGERMVAAAERVPPRVTGDGRRTVAELVAAANEDPRRGEGHLLPLTRISLDETALRVLAAQGLSAQAVPEADRVVWLRDSANLSTGGTADDVTDLVHPENARLAVRAARLVGLDVAGIDLVAPDIARPLATGGGAIIEVNAAPGIRMHHYPASGRPRDAGAEIVRLLFPPGRPARIPLVAVTGTNGKTTTCRLIAHALRRAGLTVGLTTTDGVYVNEECIWPGDNTGPVGARAVLRDARVQAAVLETARGGILREGLAYDRADVGVVTNVTEDHLGQYGVEDLADLAHVKALVVEAVGPQGAAVLNADDPLVAAMAERVRCRVVYFSLRRPVPFLRQHLATGGAAVLVEGGWVVLAEGTRRLRLLPVEQVALSRGGAALHNLANALAATAACSALGLPAALIRQSLAEFGSRPGDNPGRLQEYMLGGTRVILDYGHNPAGLASTLAYAGRSGPGRLLAVLGVPGDRPDSLIRQSGKVAGKACRLLWIKEDRDRRGRGEGEVAALLREGALAGGLGEDSVRVVLDELEATRQALAAARPGDTLVIFYELLGPLVGLLEEGAERDGWSGNLGLPEAAGRISAAGSQ